MSIDPTALVAIGSTGLEVTRLGFGTTTLGGLHAPVSDADAKAAVDAALAAGIRHFDTAPQYGTGLAEMRLGAALVGVPRERFVVSSKVGKLVVPKGSGGAPQPIFVGGSGDEIRFDYSYEGAMRSLERSYDRLGLTRVDMVLVHDVTRRFHGEEVGARFREAVDGAMRALGELKAEGKVSAIGLGMAEIEWIERFLDACRLDVVLLPGRYTLLDQTAGGPGGLLERCRREGVAVMLAAPFESGILASGPVPGATFLYKEAPPEIMARVARLEAHCRRHGVPLAAAALQFPFRHAAIASVVVGMRSAAEVAANLALARTTIPEAFWADLVADGLIGS
jgi:D-threo-aldose 1-dehydrogenase